MQANNEKYHGLGSVNRQFGQRDQHSIPKTHEDLSKEPELTTEELEELVKTHGVSTTQVQGSQPYMPIKSEALIVTPTQSTQGKTDGDGWSGLLAYGVWILVIAAILAIGALLNSLGLMFGDQHGTRWTP